MKAITFSEIKKRASDRFSYILVFCPKFPPYTRATTKTAFEKLIALIDSIMEQVVEQDSKQWLRICLQEIRQSWKDYDEGNLTEGRKLIQRAKGHFDDAFSRKPIEPRFIVGQSGAVFDEKNGFPK